MFRRSKRSVSRLKACPLCRASAISHMYVRELSDETARLQVCCGECHTWRAVLLSPDRAEVLEARLERRLARDRREIQAAVWRAELGVEDSDCPEPRRRTSTGQV
jgi:hypothetical protein